MESKFLASNDRVTIADYHAAAVVERAFSTIWGKQFIEEHPGIFNWFDGLIQKEPLRGMYKTVPYEYRDKPIEWAGEKKV